ncbi:hypothetical protein J7K43_00965 [Candidatus Calescamantes bacterium]|nr:hypothetical protein [Candidatus Calescamantes bacterium]
MKSNELFKRIKEAIDEIPVIDLHCHIRIDSPNAQNLAEILFYHFVCMEFISSGTDLRSDLPSFAHPLPKDNRVIEKVLAKYIPYLENLRNTTTYWALNKIFKDLYQFDFRNINSHNWGPLYDKILSTALDDQWTENVFKKTRAKIIVPTISDLKTFEETDKRWIKKGFFSPTLEADILQQMKDDLLGGSSIREALRRLFQRCKSLGIRSLTGGNVFFEFIKVSEVEAEKIKNKWLKGGVLLPGDKNKLSNIILEIANELEIPWVMAFGIGLPFKGEIGQNLICIDHNAIPQLCKALHEYKKVKVFIYAPAYSQSQEILTAARMFPNIYPLGFQWHGFFFPYIERMIEERLQVLPMNRPIGFMSDAYSTEWFYGKLSVVRFALAKVLSQMIEEGLYTEELALKIARRWLHDNPKEAYIR